MKLYYSNKYEDVAFSLRFIKSINSFYKEESSEIRLETESATLEGLDQVLKRLKSNELVFKGYLDDRYIDRIVKFYIRPTNCGLGHLKNIDLSNFDFSIFDVFSFANLYRSLLEGKNITESESNTFFAMQERLSKFLNFVKYENNNFYYAKILVGEVLSVKPVENYDKLFVEKVLCDKVYQIVSGIRGRYKESDLLGKKFLFIVNMKPTTLGNTKSEGMILCVCDDSNLDVIEAPIDANVGTKLSLEEDGVSVIQEFKEPIFDKKKKKSKNFMQKLYVKDNMVMFGDCKVLCCNKTLITTIKNGIVR